jgi:FtsP/CotA-like multicopper oxidase with cupredoxin domain
MPDESNKAAMSEHTRSQDEREVAASAGRGTADRAAGVSRRTFLTASSGIGTGLAVPALLEATIKRVRAAPDEHRMGMDASETDTTIVRPAPFTPGAPLIEPEVRRSVNGELRTTLRVQYAWKDVGGYRLYLRTYEGMIPGPTLRVRPGDVLRIDLVNDLPPNRDPMPAYVDQAHHLNTTNFHFHGSHVSPGGIADNVLRSMEPGRSYKIEIAIPPDHTAGTYWYHPHHHGSADVQVASGMAGAVIIEGDFDRVPEIAAARDRMMVLGEAVFDAFGTIETFETLFPETATRFLTINGQRAPTIDMRPGEVQRWRLLHAGYQDDLFLLLQGHKLCPIARDGLALDRMDQPEIRTDHIDQDPTGTLIAPGQRVDLLVQAGPPGTYELSALPYDQGYPSPTGSLARVVVAGEPLQMKLPEKLPPAPLASIRDEEITGRRQLNFSSRAPEVEATEHWREFKFLIDGRAFDMNRVDQRVRRGAVEEWKLVNLHKHDHVFHIHTNPFQVTMVNDKPLPHPMWLDTVVLPRNGSVTFRSRFLDFTGRFMLHCHMMNHEEMGMMQLVEVYAEPDAGSAADASDPAICQAPGNTTSVPSR